MRDVLAAALAALYLAACGGPQQYRPEEESHVRELDPLLCVEMWNSEYRGQLLMVGSTILYAPFEYRTNDWTRGQCICQTLTEPSLDNPFMNRMVEMYEEISEDESPETGRLVVRGLIQDYIRELADYCPETIGQRIDLGNRHMEFFDRRIGYSSSDTE